MADTTALDAMQQNLGEYYGPIHESTPVDLAEAQAYAVNPSFEAPTDWRGINISRRSSYWCRFYDEVGRRVKTPIVGGYLVIIRSGLDGGNPLAYNIVD
jgi:hypothetical protein